MKISGDIILENAENRKRVACLVFLPFRVESSRLQVDATLKNKGALFAFSQRYITWFPMVVRLSLQLEVSLANAVREVSFYNFQLQI